MWHNVLLLSMWKKSMENVEFEAHSSSEKIYLFLMKKLKMNHPLSAVFTQEDFNMVEPTLSDIICWDTSPFMMFCHPSSPSSVNCQCVYVILQTNIERGRGGSYYPNKCVWECSCLQDTCCKFIWLMAKWAGQQVVCNSVVRASDDKIETG